MQTDYLDGIIRSQKRGETRGAPSVCSAHPFVLRAAMQEAPEDSGSLSTLLIESTCNQVNQFGGYTGMTPADFVRYVRAVAEQNDFPFGNIILGGDHLGPSVWQNEPAESAMQKSADMVREYVRAGFVKIHLDCSMRLRDDPEGALDVEVSAKRAAVLAKAAEETRLPDAPAPRYVIGTEVPIPGGAQGHEEGVKVTKVEDARQTIEVTHEAFYREGLESAWERVIAVVVQPGVEFGDDFVLPYQPEAASDLSRFIESHSIVYETHSTDYQTREALKNLVRDHFAILKVGPALTFTFREAVFALTMMENELLPKDLRSNLINVLDEVMVRRPVHWRNYYHGTPTEQAFKRKFSLSDRVRYYWPDPRVLAALRKLFTNLGDKPLPLTLLSQYLPEQYERIRTGKIENTPEKLILDSIGLHLEDYRVACALTTKGY